MKIVNTKHKSKTGNIFKLCFFNLLSMKITTYHNYYFQKYYRNSKICHTKVTIMITQINVALKKKCEVRIHQCIRSPAILHTTYKESSQCQELLATNEPGFFKMTCKYRLMTKSITQNSADNFDKMISPSVF